MHLFNLFKDQLHQLHQIHKLHNDHQILQIHKIREIREIRETRETREIHKVHNDHCDHHKRIVLSILFFVFCQMLLAESDLCFKVCDPFPKRYEWLFEDEDDDGFGFICEIGKPETIFRVGRKLIVHTQKSMTPNEAKALMPNHFSCQFLPNIQVYEMQNAQQCLEKAEAFSNQKGIRASYPVWQSPLSKLGSYSTFPNDPYFSRQWYLENRDPQTALSLGVDLSIRSAWPISKGKGVRIAVVDDGVELDHPDLSSDYEDPFHYNFANQSQNGSHGVSFQAHGTAVAGLALARSNNQIGMCGVAPEANLASWVIFDRSDFIVDLLSLSEMFLFENDSVAIQNHSWGNGSVTQLAPSLIEQIAISNAVYHSRGGRGVVMIRAGGNSREWGVEHPGSGDSNDDGYASYPGVIAVAAVNDQGRVATYSSPGASLLLAVPGGEDERSLFTTDRIGRLGFNISSASRDLSNYGFGTSGFVGTSAATPLVAGIVALILSVNPDLSVRDVQQILILSSQHYDLDDPDLTRNGAGILVSHNVGYGIPNAAKALTLARDWSPRPSLIRRSFSIRNRVAIPDDALHISISGNNVSTDLRRIPASPGQGLVPDEPTDELPLIFVGRAISNIEEDLRSKAALIERGETLFIEKIETAARAGASFAIIYNHLQNHIEGGGRLRMAGTYFAPIPAVFIDHDFGEGILDALADPSLKAQLSLDVAEFEIEIEDSLLCEHVGLRVRTNHPRRADLRIILISPSGTKSILQSINNDESGGPLNWTYYSTHHFFENSRGIWKVRISDSETENAGEVIELELIIHGVAILDSDRDGLDDDWEVRFFGDLFEDQFADHDGDGNSNLIEYLLDTNPIRDEVNLKLNFSKWNESLGRISWKSVFGREYELRKTDFQKGSNLLKTFLGEEFETEFILPFEAGDAFFQIIDLGENHRETIEDLSE